MWYPRERRIKKNAEARTAQQEKTAETLEPGCERRKNYRVEKCQDGKKLLGSAQKKNSLSKGTEGKAAAI